MLKKQFRIFQEFAKMCENVPNESVPRALSFHYRAPLGHRSGATSGY